MVVGDEKTYEEAKKSLERIQSFDVQTLPRAEELGTRLNFSEVIQPAQTLIDLYKRLSITALQDFPTKFLNPIRDNANNHYNIFKQILDFDLGQTDPSNARVSLINQVKGAYEPAFQALHQFISYSLHRSADFNRLDGQARATLQGIEDRSNEISESLVQHETEARAVLNEIRKVAAEEGVTKQASHFNSEFEFHNIEAAKWGKLVIGIAATLVIFAVLSLFIHKIPILKPENTYDAIQLSISKFLIFSVIAYTLFLSAKNFLNHKHNAIVNKHRQNALMTHGALVEASGDEGIRDAVLLQAANCIFSPQSTGYTSQADNDSSQRSMVEILSKPVAQAIKEAN